MKVHTSTGQDISFMKEFGENMLDDCSWVLDWVVHNFLPEDIYSESDLEDWAEEHGYKNGDHND